MNLYIVRHGNPDYSNDCLTQLGHRQAKACAEDMVELNIDEIYSSPYGRAQETAGYLSALTGKSVEILPWAHEVEHYGDDGRGGVTLAVQMDPTFLRSPELDAMGADWAKHPAFRGEEETHKMIDDVKNGMRELLARYGYIEEGNRFRIEKPSDKNIALFCHAGTILLIAEYLLKMPERAGWCSFFTRQTGVSWVNLANFDSGYSVPRFYSLGNTDHLARRGIDIT